MRARARESVSAFASAERRLFSLSHVTSAIGKRRAQRDKGAARRLCVYPFPPFLEVEVEKTTKSSRGDCLIFKPLSLFKTRNSLPIPLTFCVASTAVAVAIVSFVSRGIRRAGERKTVRLSFEKGLIEEVDVSARLFGGPRWQSVLLLLSLSYFGGGFADLEGEELAGETAAAAAADGEEEEEGTERALRGRGGEAACRMRRWKDRWSKIWAKNCGVEKFSLFSFSLAKSRLLSSFASPSVFRVNPRTHADATLSDSSTRLSQV